MADFDGDGSPDEEDCAPEDASVHPLANDTHGDSIDQDCDGFDGVDRDGDGYPAPGDGDGWPGNVIPPVSDTPAWDCDDGDPAMNRDGFRGMAGAGSRATADPALSRAGRRAGHPEEPPGAEMWR